MTVAELMAALAAERPDALVLVPGYEGGFSAVLRVSRGPARAEEWGWYYGEWHAAGDVDGGEDRAAVALMPDPQRLSAGATNGLEAAE